jgi:hypothetical protein
VHGDALVQVGGPAGVQRSITAPDNVNVGHGSSAQTEELFQESRLFQFF